MDRREREPQAAEKEIAVNANIVNAAKRRSGFTLIEILVVIAIIAILVSLLMGAVMMFWGKGPEITNKNDILQLSTGVQNFQSKKKMYPPDVILLYDNLNAYASDNSALAKLSIGYISQLWPNINYATPMNWGGAAGALPPTGAKLEGDQCLVFFLGGPPGTGGFSTNPNNPTMAGGERQKFFDFNAARLQVVSPGATRSALFPSYIDAYGKMPFIYFSAGKSTGGYVSTNSLGVAPYRGPTGFMKPDSFQIISAGLDMRFGPGGAWDPISYGPPGKDDVANFNDGKILGVP